VAKQYQQTCDGNSFRQHLAAQDGGQQSSEPRVQFGEDGFAHDALAQTEDEEYEVQTRKLSL